jgi:hypothetical protein
VTAHVYGRQCASCTAHIRALMEDGVQRRLAQIRVDLDLRWSPAELQAALNKLEGSYLTVETVDNPGLGRKKVKAYRRVTRS